MRQGLVDHLSFRIRKLFRKGVNTFLALAYFGITNEHDESNQKYIIQINLISIATFIINSITALLFILFVDYSPGISFFLSAIMWLLPIYINRSGLKLISRVLLVLCTLTALIIASCWYTHDTMLDSYFLIVAVNATFMYSPRERKWQMISVFLALSLFIVESTSLQKHLPAYNTLLPSAAINNILLSGEIMTILVDVVIYAYISHLRESTLLNKQKKLEEAQARVQIQNEDLETFSIAASHTMQTPLHVSFFFLEKIESNLPPNATEDMLSNIGLIKSGLLQIDQLVTGLFSYNRIINLDNELTEFCVNEEIDIIWKSMLLKYPVARIAMAEKNVYIKANRLLFSTIIYNLIDNGIKYNVSNPVISIDFSRSQSNLIIFVKDNGIGISEKYFRTIFEPFKRLQADATHKSGNGLGLACAKRAAERMGGYLICEESNSSGSVFKLKIPIV